AYPPFGFYKMDGLLIQHGDAVPQYVSMLRKHEQSPLSDSEFWSDEKLKQTIVDWSEFGFMCLAQNGVRGPKLALFGDILPFIFANQTTFNFRIFRILGTTSGTYFLL